MATAKKHMLRSHRSHKKGTDFTRFVIGAQEKKYQKEQAGFFQKLFKAFHRTTDK